MGLGKSERVRLSRQIGVSSIAAATRQSVLYTGKIWQATKPYCQSARHAVLRSVGLNVFSTMDAGEAYVRIQPANCGVMLVCYSLEERIREGLAKRFRECCPKGRIISISNKYRENAVFYGDVVFDALEGAEALIDVVRRELACT